MGSEERGGKLFGQLDTNEGGQAWNVPRVRNASTGDDVVGITAPHGGTQSDFCRVHSRKARLQVLGIPLAQRVKVGRRHLIYRSPAGTRCLFVSLARAVGDRFNDRATLSSYRRTHRCKRHDTLGKEPANTHSMSPGPAFPSHPPAVSTQTGGDTRRPLAAVIKNYWRCAKHGRVLRQAAEVVWIPL